MVELVQNFYKKNKKISKTEIYNLYINRFFLVAINIPYIRFLVDINIEFKNLIKSIYFNEQTETEKTKKK